MTRLNYKLKTLVVLNLMLDQILLDLEQQPLDREPTDFLLVVNLQVQREVQDLKQTIIQGLVAQLHMLQLIKTMTVLSSHL